MYLGSPEKGIVKRLDPSMILNGRPKSIRRLPLTALQLCSVSFFFFNSFLVPHITFSPREERHVAGAQAMQPTLSEGIQSTVMAPSF